MKDVVQKIRTLVLAADPRIEECIKLRRSRTVASSPAFGCMATSVVPPNRWRACTLLARAQKAA
jgi:hypothetical protein